MQRESRVLTLRDDERISRFNPGIVKGKGKDTKPIEIQSLDLADESNLEEDIKWAESNFDEFIPKNKDVCKDIVVIRLTSRDNIAYITGSGTCKVKTVEKVHSNTEFDEIKEEDTKKNSVTMSRHIIKDNKECKTDLNASNKPKPPDYAGN